jgi:hypothetical protein
VDECKTLKHGRSDAEHGEASALADVAAERSRSAALGQHVVELQGMLAESVALQAAAAGPAAVAAAAVTASKRAAERLAAGAYTRPFFSST